MWWWRGGPKGGGGGWWGVLLMTFWRRQFCCLDIMGMRWVYLGSLVWYRGLWTVVVGASDVNQAWCGGDAGGRTARTERIRFVSGVGSEGLDGGRGVGNGISRFAPRGLGLGWWCRVWSRLAQALLVAGPGRVDRPRDKNCYGGLFAQQALSLSAAGIKYG